MGLVEIVVWSEDWKLLQFNYDRLDCAAKQKHHEWLVNCYNGRANHPVAVLQSQRQHVPAVKERSPPELSQGSIVSASTFRKDDDWRKFTFLFNQLGSVN